MRGSHLAVCGMVVLSGLAGITALYSACRSFEPAPATLGYTGSWRPYSQAATEERLLPASTDIGYDYAAWNPKSPGRRRLYRARLGIPETQSNFYATTNRGDTPAGAQWYTSVYFTYTSTNGVYQLMWFRRGKHNPDVLRFDGTLREYLLEFNGITNEGPPKLFIYAVEGLRPE